MRRKLFDLLGEDTRSEKIQSHLLVKVEKAGYVLESLQLTLNRYETVPAYFAYPTGAKNCPVVIYNHSHGGDFTLGKDEGLQGAAYLQEPFFESLLSLGYCVAAIDMWGFGERRGKAESELVKEALLTGRTLWGMRLYDDLALVDYLVTREEVDPKRIGTIGMSMGGMMSWWLAALDERIKVCVDLAGQADLETLIKERGLDHHGFYLYVPKLLKETSLEEIQSLISPKARMSLTGKDDPLCPVLGVKKLQEHLQVVYQKAEAQEHWVSHILTGGHQETREMRMIWQQFLQDQL